MKKNTKLKLEDLQVESFTTSLEEKKDATIKGGLEPITSGVLLTRDGCQTGNHTCPSHLNTECCSFYRCLSGNFLCTI
ncbi:pinensin family lanthipeptide [Roseivirga sp. BDSF3-8]|uniref:pinensin family lanthipeptide n=1 Tax=Roseivirga sp. BDSF3-8 TaxID=3241598 RepID=UPI0035325132